MAGAKARFIFYWLIGTTEVVPFYKAFETLEIELFYGDCGG